MLAACARRNSRQLGPLRRGAGSSLACASNRRMLVGDTRKARLASSPQSVGGPSADFRARAATLTPAPQPTVVANHTGPQLAATSAAQAPDASETTCGSDQPCLPHRPRQVKGRRREQSPVSRTHPLAAPLDGGESRARAATPATRGLSYAARGGYEPAPEQSPNSEIEEGEDHAADPPNPPRRRADTNIGALQESG